MIDVDAQRTRRVRRNAMLLGLLAFAFYAGFILLMMARAQP
ncbi:MAG: hypothetical protein R3E77_00295 [Steroidobacteraceae bacterium]